MGNRWVSLAKHDDRAPYENCRKPFNGSVLCHTCTGFLQRLSGCECTQKFNKRAGGLTLLKTNHPVETSQFLNS
ncbi:MAG: hypothetical protein ACKO85_02860, partial [Isosphaeraceae bacterium]